MKDKFIYVFDDEARDILIKKGFHLLQSNDEKKIYVFEKDDELRFNRNEISFATSNVLAL